MAHTSTPLATQTEVLHDPNVLEDDMPIGVKIMSLNHITRKVTDGDYVTLLHNRPQVRKHRGTSKMRRLLNSEKSGYGCCQSNI
jgi:hypothetical protein